MGVRSLSQHTLQPFIMARLHLCCYLVISDSRALVVIMSCFLALLSVPFSLFVSLAITSMLFTSTKSQRVGHNGCIDEAGYVFDWQISKSILTTVLIDGKPPFITGAMTALIKAHQNTMCVWMQNEMRFRLNHLIFKRIQLTVKSGMGRPGIWSVTAFLLCIPLFSFSKAKMKAY